MTPLTKPRWFQFTLRTFMILVTLLATWLGYVCYGVHEQRMAVARINELGGACNTITRLAVIPVGVLRNGQS